MPLSFNPRPPRRAGATQVLEKKGCTLTVSILARPEGRALPNFRHSNGHRLGFQSSPAPKGGRYLRKPDTGTLRGLFQSSPAPKGGRYATVCKYRAK